MCDNYQVCHNWQLLFISLVFEWMICNDIWPPRRRLPLCRCHLWVTLSVANAAIIWTTSNTIKKKKKCLLLSSNFIYLSEHPKSGKRARQRRQQKCFLRKCDKTQKVVKIEFPKRYDFIRFLEENQTVQISWNNSLLLRLLSSAYSSLTLLNFFT